MYSVLPGLLLQATAVSISYLSFQRDTSPVTPHPGPRFAGTSLRPWLRFLFSFSFQGERRRGAGWVSAGEGRAYCGRRRTATSHTSGTEEGAPALRVGHDKETLRALEESLRLEHTSVAAEARVAGDKAA